MVDFRVIDITIFIIANLVNLLLIGIFLSRPRGLKKAERVFGLISVSIILPIGVAVILNTPLSAFVNKNSFSMDVHSLVSVHLPMKRLMNSKVRL